MKLVGFTPEYVENITPLERDLYKMYYKEDEAERKKQQSPGISNEISLGTDPAYNEQI